MKYFAIWETPNEDLHAKCFDSYVKATDYVRSVATGKWGLFQWREGRLFWLQGSSLEDVSDLTRDIYVNKVLVDVAHND